jgi:hypothetical protein
MSGEIPIELGLEPMPRGFRGWSKRLKVAEADGVEFVLRGLGEDGAHCWIATAEAAIALAGPLAEARQREGSSGGGLIFLSLAMPQLLEPAVPAIDHDLERIRELLPMVSDKGPLDAARALLIETSAILDGCWPGLKRLARRVLADGHLDSSALDAHSLRGPHARLAIISRPRLL